jgi:hypothetical protein
LSMCPRRHVCRIIHLPYRSALKSSVRELVMINSICPAEYSSIPDNSIL